MKKLYIVSFSLIIVVFFLITILKRQPSQPLVKKENDQRLTANKEKIHSFWKIYRRANEQRIAGKLDSAAQGYMDALLYDDKHEDTLYYLGNVLLDLGQYDKAEKNWEKLIRINPKSARAYFQLGNLYLNYIDEDYFDVNKAEKYFHQVLAINKEESGSIYCIGQIELIHGNYNKARQIFDAVSGSNYNNLDASFFYSYIDWKTGNQEQAIARITSVVQSSKSAESDTAFSSEGDTKFGKPLYNSINSDRKSLFYDYIHDLRDFKEAKSYLLERFKKLDKYLVQLRAKI